jgi:exodeoxyribonuclease VII small subunit
LRVVLPGPESIKLIMPNKTNAESAAPPAAAQAPESFEQAMAELAQLVTQMESGQLPLEASVAAYARGSELVRYCAAQLEKVESQTGTLGEVIAQTCWIPGEHRVLPPDRRTGSLLGLGAVLRKVDR